MSISSLTSPPSPTSSSLMTERNSRRVRFSLPEAKLTLHNDKRTVHGTTKYINGTLINVTSAIHTTNNDPLTKSSSTNGTKASCMKGSNGSGKEYKLALRPASTSVNGSIKEYQGQRHSLPSATSSIAAISSRRRGSKNFIIGRNEKTYNTLPIIENSLAREVLERKSSSFDDDFDEDTEVPRKDDKDAEQKMIPATNLTKYKSSDDLRELNNFKVKNSSVLKLPEAYGINNNGNGKGVKTTNTLRVPEFNETQPLQSCEINQKHNADEFKCDSNNIATGDIAKTNENTNLDEFFQFVEKWRTNRVMTNKKMDDIFRNSTFQSRCSFKNSESKSSSLLSARLKAFKMSLDQVELVSKLLRASRNCNELQLKDCFKEILEHGITPKELNSTDKSGRTALSYICSTNLTNFLELFLHLPGIDVNKPDNEGNSALHFAAQAGQTDIVNMLLTKCKGINIDAKNNLGFTPLMKAALQGRTKTAKLLLFAGASAIATDPTRGFRADQWARYCGRHQTAEMIETVARAKLLDKSTSNKWTHDVIPRSKTTSSMSQNILQQHQPQQQSHSGGFRSKFRKVFPFGFSLKDKHREKDDKNRNGFVNMSSDNKKDGVDENGFCNGEIVNYLTAAAICVGNGPGITSNGSNKQIIKSLCRPLTVPKLEVTYANNNNLIKKFENMPNMTPEPVPEEKTTIKKKVNGIRKVFSEKSKGIINGSGGKQKVNTDAYF
ncbi:hypothetical protein PVAND_009963 [Polypedilum vanderplanki]|uniref:Uncharacterized protein n=1 Tax=Polypedilum vanderplanki TaxID=319348 RepID=A0A9J6CEW0_POLVA|nr:hypothetical protein PVAND_009963 [Polypedilum vanderplanki]